MSRPTGTGDNLSESHIESNSCPLTRKNNPVTMLNYKREKIGHTIRIKR